MIKIIDEKLVGTRNEIIEHFENMIQFLSEEEHLKKINDILEEVKNHIEDEIEIFFNSMDEKFHILKK